MEVLSIRRTEMEEANIYQRFKSGDSAAVESIFYRYFPMMRQTAFHIVRTSAIADDIAQEAFIKFWRKRNTIEIKRSLKSYLKQIAVNEALYYLRKQLKKETMDVDVSNIRLRADSVEEILIGKELEMRIYMAIDELPPRCREIFMLHRFEGLSYSKIAKKLNLSPKTIEHQISTALQRLRPILNAQNN